LIPDRSHILTEQRNPRSAGLHAMSAAECARLINSEDALVAGAVERALPALVAYIEAVEPGFAAGGRLVYVGAGTSGRLGVLDASECPPTFQLPEGRVIGIIAGGDGALRRSSEGREDEPGGAAAELDALKLGAGDALLGIAAGGTTPYVHGAIAHAKSRGCGVTGLLSCSPVPRPTGCDHLIVIEAGPEVLTGSTRMKAGTATKLALNTISTTLMVRTGRVYQNLMVDLRASNAKLRDRAARIVSTLTGLGREEALRLIDDAGGSVKTAIAMRQHGLTRPAAEAWLAARGGRLE
jgi:N-acetylmuramic acid 6-phosphate etherase